MRPFLLSRSCAPHQRDELILQLYFFFRESISGTSAFSAQVPLYTVSRLSQYVKDRCVPSGTPVENNGFEPLTPCVQSRCSSQLS